MASDDEVRETAIRYAKAHKKEIAARLTSTDLFHSEKDPVAIFMAGSPGAGKTESSIELIAKVGEVVRIDPDELRAELPGYNGANAALFQGAVSILVDRILDTVYKSRQTFLLDGTFTNEAKAEANIARAVRNDRLVQILFVYQDPCQAWQFVQAREAIDGRRIEIETFIYQYFEARRVVNSMKRKFGSDVLVDLLWKNNDGKQRAYEANIQSIDHHCSEEYDELRLRVSLSTMQVADELSTFKAR